MAISIEDFLENFKAQFENTEPAEIMQETKFKDLEEWDSMMALRSFIYSAFATTLLYRSSTVSELLISSPVRRTL